jgi:hypothetical protein
MGRRRDYEDAPEKEKHILDKIWEFTSAIIGMTFVYVSGFIVLAFVVLLVIDIIKSVLF